MATCGRCGKTAELQVFWAGGKRRERLCEGCHAEAKENRGLTVEQIAEENERWERTFQKFVDPTYYRRPAMATLQSSFGAFASQMETLYRA